MSYPDLEEEELLLDDEEELLLPLLEDDEDPSSSSPRAAMSSATAAKSGRSFRSYSHSPQLYIHQYFDGRSDIDIKSSQCKDSINVQQKKQERH